MKKIYLQVLFFVTIAGFHQSYTYTEYVHQLYNATNRKIKITAHLSGTIPSTVSKTVRSKNFGELNVGARCISKFTVRDAKTGEKLTEKRRDDDFDFAIKIDWCSNRNVFVYEEKGKIKVSV